jgi:hypothetical protein
VQAPPQSANMARAVGVQKDRLAVLENAVLALGSSVVRVLADGTRELPPRQTNSQTRSRCQAISLHKRGARRVPALNQVGSIKVLTGISFVPLSSPVKVGSIAVPLKAGSIGMASGLLLCGGPSSDASRL